MLSFLWILHRRLTELAWRVAFGQREGRKQGFAFFGRYYWHKSSYMFQGSKDVTLYWGRQPRHIWRKPRSVNWWENIVLKTFTSQDWLENFRMHKNTFIYLCNQLKLDLQR